MRDDLNPGKLFPDFTLPDQDGQPFRLSEYMNGWPTVVTFVRGHY
jgi:peroxiredoxin